MAAAQFDLAIIGAGAAGLQLVYEYYQVAENTNSAVLLIDSGDRTKKSWCFWAESGEESFPALIEKSWPNITYRSSKNVSKTEQIGHMAYHYISSTNYYQYFFEEFIPKHPQITVVNGWVDDLQELESHVSIIVKEGSEYQAKEVADSRTNAKTPCTIQQHFLGKFIEFEDGILDDQSITIMDFSQKQSHEHFTAFHYVLPFNPTSALVETTVFSKMSYDRERYEQLWKEYMLVNFPDLKYRIHDIEIGSIPMCVTEKPVRSRSKIYKIGTAGGQVKSSTGYAFTRMHRFAKLQVLKKEVIASSRFAFYDSILLQMIKSENQVIPAVMDSLFENTAFDKILRFLDEKTSLWEEIGIFCRLNIPLFLKHLAKIIR